MSSNEIGLNYATALFESLTTAGDLQRAGDDLETFEALLKQVPALSRVLDHPGMSIEKRLSVLDDVLDRMKPVPVMRRFIRIVVEKGRVTEIPGIVSAFIALRDARLNHAQAEVVTAVPIDSSEREAWERTLARLSGKQVKVTYRTDGSLIGGAVARVGSVVYDGSVRRQLARIRGVLIGE